ncbi:MAG: hypothetical protein RLZ32_856 [Gemmatimonadota bacterium]
MQVQERDLTDASRVTAPPPLRPNGTGTKFGPASRTDVPDHQGSGHYSVRHGLGANAPRMEPTSAGRHERLERTLRERLLPDLIAPRFPVGVVAEARAAGGRAEGTPIPPSEVEALVRHLRAPEDHVAAAYVRTLLDAGTPLDQLYLELLAPAARQLGALWESDDCSFVEVTVGLGRLQLLLRDLSQLFLAPAPAGDPVGTVLLTAVPGEQHTLGLVMVGEFLLRDGWRVMVGAPWTEDDLVARVSAEWVDVLGYSVGSAQRLAGLAREIRRVKGASRNSQLQIMVGGPLFADQPTLVAEVGAHALAADGRQAPQVARTLLAASRAGFPVPARREEVSGHVQFSQSSARA